MKGILLAAVLAGGMISAGAQEKLSTNRKTMKTHTSTIRLIYPQWQGGNVAAMVPEVKDWVCPVCNEGKWAFEPLEAN